MKRLLIALGCLILATASHAASKKPLVYSSTNQPQNLQSGDALWNGTNPFGLMSGAFTSGHCLQSGGSALVVDAGAACGSGSGGVTSVSCANADCTVATGTTTPVITIVSAPKIDTGRTISITGDLAYTSPSFDGSGNVTAAGTLATVNSGPGACGDATHVCAITTNGKGLTTAQTATAITFPSAPGAANPTATVGTSAVNGSASTFLRSDGAPAIDLTMAPTWTGLHTFSAGAQITPEATPPATEVGFQGIPQIGGAAKTSGYTITMADLGGHLLMNCSSPCTVTIPANGTAAVANGQGVDIINEGTAVVTIAITSDTLKWGNAGAISTGSRALAIGGTAQVLKIISTTWWLSGGGIS